MIVAIYARVSTSDQSCEMPLHELRQYVQKRNWQIFEEYVDTGFSVAAASRSLGPFGGPLRPLPGSSAAPPVRTQQRRKHLPMSMPCTIFDDHAHYLLLVAEELAPKNIVATRAASTNQGSHQRQQDTVLSTGFLATIPAAFSLRRQLQNASNDRCRQRSRQFSSSGVRFALMEVLSRCTRIPALPSSSPPT